MIIKSKGLEDFVDVVQPSSIGGLTSPEYKKLNPNGKMPLLLTQSKYPIAESDTISRYLIDKYASKNPSFVPNQIQLRVLSDQICRLHDIYITPIQGCMYKAPGYLMGTYGTNRKEAMAEFLRQLQNIDDMLRSFDAQFPGVRKGGYLCGPEISLADATLFPTLIFCHYMLPRYFDLPVPGSYALNEWYSQLPRSDRAAHEVKAEIEAALNAWSQGGRWDPILAEMKNK